MALIQSIIQNVEAYVCMQEYMYICTCLVDMCEHVNIYVNINETLISCFYR